MNILFLNSLGRKKWGGGEKWMINAASGLAMRGHKVFIATRKGSLIEQKAKIRGLEIIHFSFFTDLDFHKITGLQKILKNHTINVLVCCQNKDVKIGGKAARMIGTPAIFARQGVQNLSNKQRYVKPFTQYIDGIITNTASIKSTYESFGWFPDNFIHVVYNGVKITANTQQINLRDKFGIPPEASVIASAGRLDYQKGFDLLITVAEKSKRLGLNWYFLVAGQGKLKNKLDTLAKEMKVEERFKLIGFYDDIEGFIKSADVFVLPSRYEGMPNVVLEAMSLGKACVVTRVNGAAELIEHNKSGILVDWENPEVLFAGIKEVLTDDQLKTKLEQQALKRVSQNFTLDKMIDQLETIFLRQISSKSLSE